MILDPITGWNPYYVAYATAHGRTPADQLAHDKAARPHASMMEYLLWGAGQWAEFETENPRGKFQPRDHAGYGGWLARRWGTEVTA